MKLLSWNINGLRSIWKKGFSEIISKLNPDVICLQEIKITEEEITSLGLLLDDYTHVVSCAKKPGYSGVLTYIKSPLANKIANSQIGIGISDIDIEGRLVKTKIKNLSIINSYFPSGTTGEQRQSFKYYFLKEFSNYLNSLSTIEQENLIICGDFNICHKENDIHHPEIASKRELSGFLPEERAWMDEFTQLGFVDSFRHINGNHLKAYTWWTFRAGAREKNLGWRIDYFFTSKKISSKIKSAKILSNIKGSDHCPIILEISE